VVRNPKGQKAAVRSLNSMSKRKMIAFVGLRRSGKDTAALALVNQGWKLVKFADALKGMLRYYLDYVGVHPEVIEELIEGSRKEEPNDNFCGKSCRWAMQSLGTEWGRNLIGDDLWVRATMSRAWQYQNTAISDCRFPNEAEAIHQNGGKIIRIERAGLIADSHPSEAGIATLPYDFSLVNDGTVDELQQKVLQLISSI
jgi:deoxynucleotide monophosphate kinase-like protein